MRNDLDARGRAAAARLRQAVDQARLTAVPPGTPNRPSRRFGALRPAWVAGFLLVGSAVGVAIVVTPSEPTATTAPGPTTATTVTTAPVVVVPPSTTIPAGTEPPLLEILSPADGATLKEKTVQFSGVTEPGASVFAGRWEAEVDPEGNWNIVLVLSEGANRARFTARDAAGNESVASITVHYAPTTTTTKPEKPVKAEFTAHATFGTCTENPPYDVYYGTGEPGSNVYVDSIHGGGSVQVGQDGAWEVKVFFPTAPAGEAFDVKVYDDYGRKKTFQFTFTP